MSAEFWVRVQKHCAQYGNYRVVVDPAEPGGTRCYEVMMAIRRHVDGVGRVQMKCDVVCKFCGYGWDAALDEAGKPACCIEAVAEFDRLVQEAQDDD